MFLSNSVAMLESIRNGQQMALTCGPSACSMWALNNGNWNSNHLSYKLIINNTTESRVGNTFLYLKVNQMLVGCSIAGAQVSAWKFKETMQKMAVSLWVLKPCWRFLQLLPRIYAPIRDEASNVHICALAVSCVGLWIPFWHVQPFFEFWALWLDGLLGMTQMQFMNN